MVSTRRAEFVAAGGRSARRRIAGLACLLVLTVACTSPSAATGLTLDHGAVVRGSRAEKTLALIFTGGEHGEGTTTILDVLDARRVPGSFFVTGDYLMQAGLRVAVRRMLAAGHYVGPHSHAHLLYCPWDDRARSLVDRATFGDDLQRNIVELRALGALPAGHPVYFIPPYEWFNGEHVAWAADLGVVLFNFTPGTGSNRDYIPEGQRGFVPSVRIREDILAFEAAEPDGLNGFLLLLHLGSMRTDKMHGQIGLLLDALLERGYRFRRVDELLAGARQR